MIDVHCKAKDMLSLYRSGRQGPRAAEIGLAGPGDLGSAEGPTPASDAQAAIRHGRQHVYHHWYLAFPLTPVSKTHGLILVQLSSLYPSNARINTIMSLASGRPAHLACQRLSSWNFPRSTV